MHMQSIPGLLSLLRRPGDEANWIHARAPMRLFYSSNVSETAVVQGRDFWLCIRLRKAVEKGHDLPQKLSVHFNFGYLSCN